MRVPLILAVANRAAINAVSGLAYDANLDEETGRPQGLPLIRLGRLVFHAWRIRVSSGEGKPPVKRFSLAVKSAHTSGKWMLWQLHPEEAIRRCGKQLLTAVQDHLSTAPPGYLLGPYPAKQFRALAPPALVTAVRGALTVIAGDSADAQWEQDTADLEDVAP